jgi:UDP-N-acetylglucosamine 1-carboxyvinyltransferase
MDKIQVIGGNSLIGEITVSGAKNAALPIMAAALLSDKDLKINNIPYLHDIISMQALLEQLGANIRINGESGLDGSKNRSLIINCKNINNFVAPYDLVRKMRASILVLGPLLGRFGQAKVSLPGGCAIGTRPINLHLSALEKMGAEIVIEEGYVTATAKNGLKGIEIIFEKVSVGATENIMMAAVLAQGQTIIKNAALEPEIKDLADCLNAMGAKVEGAATDTITIEGVTSLNKAEHNLIADRIEAGTYAIAAAITGGRLQINNVNPEILSIVLHQLENANVEVNKLDNGFIIKADNKNLKPLTFTTSPYPNFPTDMQAQMMSLLTIANGTSTITETIFENRFMHVPELTRMGAMINLNDNTAIINGTPSLTGAEVMATDLRASVSLILAALSAKGKTIINRVYHLDRGYEHIEHKLRACGAEIERIS